MYLFMFAGKTILEKQNPIQKKKTDGGKTRPSVTDLPLYSKENQTSNNNLNDFHSRPSSDFITPVQRKLNNSHETIAQRASSPITQSKFKTDSTSDLQRKPQIAFDNINAATQFKEPIPLNDTASLENEADIMGGKAVQMFPENKVSKISARSSRSLNNSIAPIQGFFGFGKKKENKNASKSTKNSGGGVLGWIKSLFSLNRKDSIETKKEKALAPIEKVQETPREMPQESEKNVAKTAAKTAILITQQAVTDAEVATTKATDGSKKAFQSVARASKIVSDAKNIQTLAPSLIIKATNAEAKASVAAKAASEAEIAVKQVFETLMQVAGLANQAAAEALTTEVLATAQEAAKKAQEAASDAKKYASEAVLKANQVLNELAVTESAATEAENEKKKYDETVATVEHEKKEINDDSVHEDTQELIGDTTQQTNIMVANIWETQKETPGNNDHANSILEQNEAGVSFAFAGINLVLTGIEAYKLYIKVKEQGFLEPQDKADMLKIMLNSSIAAADIAHALAVLETAKDAFDLTSAVLGMGIAVSVIELYMLAKDVQQGFVLQEIYKQSKDPAVKAVVKSGLEQKLGPEQAIKFLKIGVSLAAAGIGFALMAGTLAAAMATPVGWALMGVGLALFVINEIIKHQSKKEKRIHMFYEGHDKRDAFPAEELNARKELKSENSLGTIMFTTDYAIKKRAIKNVLGIPKDADKQVFEGEYAIVVNVLANNLANKYMEKEIEPVLKPLSLSKEKLQSLLTHEERVKAFRMALLR